MTDQQLATAVRNTARKVHETAKQLGKCGMADRSPSAVAAATVCTFFVGVLHTFANEIEMANPLPPATRGPLDN